MTKDINLKEIERKAYRDSLQDGLMELVMGVCLAAMSSRALSPAFIGMFVLAPLLFRRVLMAMRRRFTYPRIGYVKLVDEKPKEVLGGIATVMLIVIAAMAVAFVIFGDVRSFALWLKWFPAFVGVLLAGMFSSIAAKSGLIRHYAFALASVISGLVFSILRFEPLVTGLFIYFLVMGVLLILCGLVIFIRFLRRHPLPAEEESDVNA